MDNPFSFTYIQNSKKNTNPTWATAARIGHFCACVNLLIAHLVVSEMAEVQCYEPSLLITSTHEGVPFLTDADSENNSADLVLKLDESTKEFYDHFVVRKLI